MVTCLWPLQLVKERKWGDFSTVVGNNVKILSQDVGEGWVAGVKPEDEDRIS